MPKTVAVSSRPIFEGSQIGEGDKTQWVWNKQKERMDPPAITTILETFH